MFSVSFAITKFFVKGPLPILPQNAPLAGLLSAKFFLLMCLNTMFVVRTFSLEGALTEKTWPIKAPLREHFEVILVEDL